eukprot:67641_1
MKHYMLLTLCTIIFSAESGVYVADVNLTRNDKIWRMDPGCSVNETINISNGCNVTISAPLSVEINNTDLAPVVVDMWTIQHRFFCARELNCATSGYDINIMEFEDGVSEINAKSSGYVMLNDTEMIELNGCTWSPVPNDTYCACALNLHYT